MTEQVQSSSEQTQSGQVSAEQAVADIVAASGTSFALGMRVLPRDRREAMHALYAFCRVVDDIVDEPGAEVDQRAALDEWRAEIDRLYDGHPTHPIGVALAEPARRFDLPKAEFLEIIDGMAMDLGDGVRAPTSDGLALYCRRVAGAVGMISVRIFGVDEALGPRLAVAQGEALQLTNILRDLVEDAAIGRLYLPADLLAKHGIESTDPDVVLADPRIALVCRDVAAQARSRYREARTLLQQADRKAVRASRLMLEVYERILGRLEQRGWQALDQDVGLSKLEKIGLFLRYGL